MACPLCGHGAPEPFFSDRRRDYLRCTSCALISVPDRFHLGEVDERAEYALHRNSPDDPGYRAFLGRLFTPLNARLPAASTGLDFGCGPGPTLSLMFEEAGHTVALYDKFYAPDPAVFEQAYDFITATEVVEHLQAPRVELERLWGCLRPGGWLGIMTKLALDVEAFGRWHYRNDPTHITFFSHHTFAWLGERWGATPEFIGSDVILLRHP